MVFCLYLHTRQIYTENRKDRNGKMENWKYGLCGCYNNVARVICRWTGETECHPIAGTSERRMRLRGEKEHLAVREFVTDGDRTPPNSRHKAEPRAYSAPSFGRDSRREKETQRKTIPQVRDSWQMADWNFHPTPIRVLRKSNELPSTGSGQARSVGSTVPVLVVT